MLLDTGAGQQCPSLAPYPPAPPLAPPAPAPPSPFAPPGLGAEPEVAGCPPGPGPCLGYVGNCADLQEQFATLQGCYVYGAPGEEEEHQYLDEYECHAFPDDAYVTDQFFVGASAPPAAPAQRARCS
jgi:hypothetical protein